LNENDCNNNENVSFLTLAFLFRKTFALSLNFGANPGSASKGKCCENADGISHNDTASK